MVTSRCLVYRLHQAFSVYIPYPYDNWRTLISHTDLVVGPKLIAEPQISKITKPAIHYIVIHII